MFVLSLNNIEYYWNSVIWMFLWFVPQKIHFRKSVIILFHKLDATISSGHNAWFLRSSLYQYVTSLSINSFVHPRGEATARLHTLRLSTNFRTYFSEVFRHISRAELLSFGNVQTKQDRFTMYNANVLLQCLQECDFNNKI